MSFIEAFAPPVTLNLPTGKSVQFRRVVMDEWGGVCAAIKAARVAKANELIGLDKELKPEQKLAARRRAEAEDVDVYDAMAYCTRSIDGIKLILKQQMIASDVPLAEAIQYSSLPDLTRIADEIVYRPIVWPKTEDSGKNGQSGDGTGNSTPPESGTSTTATPESSPSDSLSDSLAASA